METELPGKRERNKADKLRRIIAAARKLFEANGFEATTTAQISQLAGVGTGTLYLYFESKEELLVEVFTVDVGQAWLDAFDEVDPEAPLTDQLLQGFGHMVDYHLRDPELARAYFKELSFLGPGPRSQARKVMTTNRQLVIELLTAAVERGELAADVDLNLLADTLQAQWYHLMRGTLSGRLPTDGVGPRLADSFDLILRGLLTD